MSRAVQWCLAVVALMSVLAVVAHAQSTSPAGTATEAAHEAAFNVFIRAHNKQYNSTAERQHRFQIFKQASETIAAHNARNAGWTMAINKFADVTAAEFRSSLGYVRSNSTRSFPALPNAPLVNPPGHARRLLAPTTFDWCLTEGKCTPVKDQGQCYSDWAFAAVENIESVWAIAGRSNALLPLSPQQIVDCDSLDDGCSGGDPSDAFSAVISQGGLNGEADYQYQATDGTCAFNRGGVYAAISGASNAYGGSESQMAANLAVTAPLTVVVDATSWQYYSGGILPSSSCSNSVNHAAIAAGYDQNNQYWNIRNSWGAGWGENGYIRLQFGENTCGITSEVLTAHV